MEKCWVILNFPLCEVLSGGNNILVAIGKIWVYLTNKIESPVGKGPWGDGGLKVLGKGMYRITMLLTRNTYFHKMISIHFHSRPIVTHSEDFFANIRPVEWAPQIPWWTSSNFVLSFSELRHQRRVPSKCF